MKRPGDGPTGVDQAHEPEDPDPSLPFPAAPNEGGSPGEGPGHSVTALPLSKGSPDE